MTKKKIDLFEAHHRSLLAAMTQTKEVMAANLFNQTYTMKTYPGGMVYIDEASDIPTFDDPNTEALADAWKALKP